MTVKGVYAGDMSSGHRLLTGTAVLSKSSLNVLRRGAYHPSTSPPPEYPSVVETLLEIAREVNGGTIVSWNLLLLLPQALIMYLLYNYG